MRGTLLPVRSRPAWALLVAAGVTVCVGCAAPDGGGGEASASCAALVEYGNSRYVGTEAKGFALGERLGAASLPPCDDTPGDDSDGETAPTPTTAYEIKGVDPGVAIAVERSADDVIYVNVDSATELPEIKELIRGS
ncbi:DUF6281 family protein [Streptomyces sp. NPDC088387]|uniref:DUF6281 family protein n=1 Tax=Streptomyces sp. NPDC088387 TaxID=3365859 RepID=UPI00382287C1